MWFRRRKRTLNPVEPGSRTFREYYNTHYLDPDRCLAFLEMPCLFDKDHLGPHYNALGESWR